MLKRMLSVVMLWAACSDASFHAPALNDISAAPAAIQTAAKAIGRIAVSQGSGTAAFLSANGLMITNNHVLGIDICPVEGCWATLTMGLERGAAIPKPQIVFVKPVTANVGLDIAIVQVSDGQGGSALSTPDFLTLAPRDSTSLMGSHIYVVGHPEARLKKWSSGVVVDSLGDWFESNAFILPGSSGSPVLDDAGEMVGIMHRGPTGEDLITSEGYTVSSLGTAAAAIIFALSAGNKFNS